MDYTTIPNNDVIEQTKKSMTERGFVVEVVENKTAALEWLKTHIPQGSTIMNGSSTTLHEIGFTDYLKADQHGWNNLHEKILEEKDWGKQGDLRRHAIVDADIFLASVNAIAQTGELVAVDQTGSRVGAFPFAAKKLILIVGAQKITSDFETAMQRIREYVFPLEDVRAQKAYGVGTAFGKWVIIEREKTPERIQIVLVKEKLGF